MMVMVVERGHVHAATACSLRFQKKKKKRKKKKKQKKKKKKKTKKKKKKRNVTSAQSEQINFSENR